MPVAYVQLKPGATVTEQELLEHAALTISERAAIPKRIKISSSLPTTAVGKLFKPALVEREIEETVRRGGPGRGGGHIRHGRSRSQRWPEGDRQGCRRRQEDESGSRPVRFPVRRKSG
jgi:hypothetical protein